VASLDSEIDALYHKPLDEFTSARNALAKTLAGDDAARVRKLAKPTVVPWSVNQLYWHARPVFDRLRTAGERLRSAQIAALKGKSADLRGAGEAQRRAVADAVQHASALAAKAGSHPNADELTRTLEALSLAAELPEAPGRLTRPLQPAGFEALAGVPIRAQISGPAKSAAGPAKAGHHVAKADGVHGVGHRAAADPAATRRAEREAREREAREQAEQRRAQADVHRAEAVLDRARAAEAQARAAWERAKGQVQEAERAVSEAHRRVKS
jgi:hypothetical protein